MYLFKVTTFFLVFSLVQSAQVSASDYEQLVTPNDECTVVFTQCMSSDEQCSIDYLRNMPDASWCWPIVAGVATLFPLAVAVVPGATACSLLSDIACALTATETGVVGVIGTVAGMAGTVTLGRKTKKAFNKKQEYLKLVQLIVDAYGTEEEINTNSVRRLLTDYQTSRPSDQHRPIDLAEKIKLANRAGLFVPTEAFTAAIDRRLAEHAQCLDLPKRDEHLATLELGELFDKEIMEIVSILATTSTEELETKRTAFTNKVETWQQQIAAYLDSIASAKKARSL